MGKGDETARWREECLEAAEKLAEANDRIRKLEFELGRVCEGISRIVHTDIPAEAMVAQIAGVIGWVPQSYKRGGKTDGLSTARDQ